VLELLQQLGWEPPDWIVVPAATLAHGARFGKGWSPEAPRSSRGAPSRAAATARARWSLALEPEWIHGIEEVDPQTLACLVGELEAVVESCADEQCAGAVRERLGELPQRHLPLGTNTSAQGSERGIGGQRRRGIAVDAHATARAFTPPRLRHPTVMRGP